MEDNETFDFDKEFLGIYTYFLNKYSSEFANYSAQELVKDLKHYFSCLAVALLHYEPESDPTPTIYYPFNEQEKLIKILNNEKTKDAIIRSINSECYSGESLTIDFSVIADNIEGDLEIDIVLVPNLASSEFQNNSFYLFILIDPVRLKPLGNNKAKRDWQRSMLAQFLGGWWIRVSAPKFKISSSKVNSFNIQKIPSPSINRLYYATLSELILEGNRSAEQIRHSTKKSISFDGELAGQTFDWEKWSPRLFFPEHGNLKLEKIRDKGRILISLCKWVNSHHALEKEVITERSQSTLQNNDNIPVNMWFKNQKSDLESISCSLKDLYNLSSNEFNQINNEFKRDSVIPSHENKIQINTKTLLCFSLNRWISPNGKLFAALNNGMLSDIEFCRMLHSIAVTSQFIFGDQHISDDTIHRLMQLVAYYGHVELGIPARIDLRAHLLQSARGEPALHSLKQFYRDHFFHSLEVCFLGNVLLETKVNNNEYLWQIIARFLNLPEDDKNSVLRLWYLTALLHDIGYAMDVLNSSRKFFNFFHHSKALKSLDESFEKAIKRLSNKKEFSIFGIAKYSGIEQDHGVVSALHLYSLINKISEDDNSIFLDDFLPSIQAIALHNLRRINDEIVFSKQPLAFLLALCDQLQEWRRPQLPFSTSPNWFLSKLGGSLDEPSNKNSPIKSIKTNLTQIADSECGIAFEIESNNHEKPILEISLEYNDNVNKNSSLFSIWLDATYNFQRLNFDGFPIEIQITYKSPLFKNHDHMHPQSQLFRLRNAAHETHMTFLYNWFPTSQKGTMAGSILTNGAVSHSLGLDQEELTLDLRQLSRKNLITRDMDAFWKCIQEWKNFNDDRDFPGDYVSVIPE
jgi:hypothetical protein